MSIKITDEIFNSTNNDNLDSCVVTQKYEIDQLYGSIENGDLARCCKLLDSGLYIEEPSSFSYDEDLTPLLFAAAHGKTDICKLLIERGAKINIQDVREMTPLHKAAEHGHSATCLALIDLGADVNIKDWDEMSPFHLASKSGQSSVCLAFLEKLPYDEDCVINAIRIAKESGKSETESILNSWVSRSSALSAISAISGILTDTDLKSQHKKLINC